MASEDGKVLRKSSGVKERSGNLKPGDVDNKRKLPEVLPAQVQRTEVSDADDVHTVNNRSVSKVRRKMTAQELRCKLDEVRDKIKCKQEVKSKTIESPVQGRADVGKKLACLIKDIPGEGPGVWRLGLDLLGPKEECPLSAGGRGLPRMIFFLVS